MKQIIRKAYLKNYSTASLKYMRVLRIHKKHSYVELVNIKHGTVIYLTF